MSERISPRQFHEADGVEDWRVVGEGACAFFRTGSFADGALLSHLTRDPEIDAEHMDLRELGAAMEADERTWIELLAKDLDADAVVKDVDEDGYERDAMIGIRLAQALHHGTDHRSQICTALTTLGVEPPGIDVWDFGVQAGRVVEVPPTS